MHSLLVMVCLLALVSSKFLPGKNPEFESFKWKFGKSYKSAFEEKFRQKIFLDNLKIVADHNKLHEEEAVSFDLEINQFADMTSQELAKIYNGFRLPANYKPKNVFRSSGETDVPASIDWRDYGYVAVAKDQGQCGCSWAFSAIGALQGQHFGATGNMVSLSEQNLLDCTWEYGNQGCNGGWVDAAFQYVIDNNGIDTEASYPYQEKDGLCRYSAQNKGATASNYTDVESGNEDALRDACGLNGPISAAIDTSHSSFWMYKSGIYYNPLCSSDLNNLDQSVLVIGYGTENGEDYFLVQTSWGVGWGQEGVIKMSRNRDNNCGIATQASWPQV